MKFRLMRLGALALATVFGASLALAQSPKPGAAAAAPQPIKLDLIPLQAPWTKVCQKDPTGAKEFCRTIRAFGQAADQPPTLAMAIDTLTGEYQIERTDILHDVGKSLNPAIDKGQVEGAFVQGAGWLTTEELWWDGKGRLRTHAPSTYKIPLASDRPRIFNVELAEWSVNKELTIGRSKAVGEPPLMLGVSVLEALSMAVASVADYRVCPRLDAPATPERVLMAVERMRVA